MKRYQRLLGFIALSLLAWALVTFNVVHVDLSPPVREVVTALPSYLLIVLGCYALLSIGSALVTFGDCDAAHLEVQQQVEEAKAFYRSHGLKIDS